MYCTVKLFKENNHPWGKNSPNLVTLQLKLDDGNVFTTTLMKADPHKRYSFN
jgi:hypothetical protein